MNYRSIICILSYNNIFVKNIQPSPYALSKLFSLHTIFLEKTHEAHFYEHVGLGLHCQTKEKAGAFKLQVCGIQNSAKTWNF